MMVFFALMVGALLLATVVQSVQEETRRSPLRLPRRTSTPTTVELEIAGLPALLTQRPGEPSTLLDIRSPGRDRPRLLVFNDEPWKKPRREDQRIGDPAFDRAWILQGAGVRDAFAPEVRAEMVAAVDALRRFPKPRVSGGPDGLQISLRGLVRREDEMRVLLRSAAAMAEALRLRTSEEVLFIETRSDAPAVCQVCGVSMEAQVVRCRRCRTPHHRECWTYNRRCSTFGCGEEGFLRG